MNRSTILLAVLFLLFVANRAQADVPKDIVARLNSEIAKAKTKLVELRDSRKFVLESYSKYHLKKNAVYLFRQSKNHMMGGGSSPTIFT